MASSAKKKQKKLVVFDFDGTIVDSLTTHRIAYQKTFRAFGRTLPVSTDLGFKRWHDSVWENNYLRGGFAPKEIPLAFKKYWRFIDYSRVKPFEGFKRTLEILSQKYQLAIISHSIKKPIERVLRSHGLRGFFAAVEGGRRKSGKKSQLARVMKKFDTAPHETIMIGDTPSDVRAGKACGTKTIGILYGWAPRKKILREKPDAVARKPSDTPRLVEKLFNE